MPEMKGNRNALATAQPQTATLSTVAAKPNDPSSDRTQSTTVTTDPVSTAKSTTVALSENTSPKSVVAQDATLPRPSKVRARSAIEDAPERGARAIIGAPTTESDRLAAIDVFEQAKAYMGQHLWSKAEASFREALRFDGSVAKYHADLASLLMMLGRYDEAEAEYSAALLLDVDNTAYRRFVKQARSKR
jgi:tetratricopeptide (TPR) repeat protein